MRKSVDGLYESERQEYARGHSAPLEALGGIEGDHEQHYKNSADQAAKAQPAPQIDGVVKCKQNAVRRLLWKQP